MEAEVVRYLLKEEKRKTCSACKTGIVLCAIFKAIEDFSHDLDAGRTFRRTGNAYRRDGDFV